LPVRASTATTTLHGPVVYMVPSTTIGDPWIWPGKASSSALHTRPSLATLAVVICVNGL
jgi:hypothetical protein